MENKDKFNALRSHMQMKSFDDELMQFSEFKSRGYYRDIQIELNAVLKGDVKARNIKCNGETAINGNIVSETLTVNGLSKITGDIKCDRFELHGEIDIDGAIESAFFNCDGKTKINNNIKVEEFELNGNYDSNNSIVAGKFTGKGGLNTDTLEASVIDLNITKKSLVNKIKGSNIKITTPKSGFLSKLMSKGHNLEVEKIEGDVVSISNIKVKEIVGRDITIGDNVVVENVYYTDNLKVENTAKVSKSEKR